MTGAAEGPRFLGRLSRTCGVLIIVATFFMSWSGNWPWIRWTEDDTWLGVFFKHWEDMGRRGLILPFRGIAPGSTPADRDRALWTVEAFADAMLLLSIPLGAVLLVLGSRRGAAPLVALWAAVLGTATSPALFVRLSVNAFDPRTSDFSGGTRDVLAWAFASVPLAIGVAVAFGAWQRRPWAPRAVVAFSALVVTAAIAPPVTGSPELLSGVRGTSILFAFGLVLELVRVRSRLTAQEDSNESTDALTPAVAKAAVSWSRAIRGANRASFVVLALSLAFLGLLARRATRPLRLNDPYDDWPVLVDVNKPVPHDGTIEALAFSPTGDFLASGSADGTVRLWSMPGGTLVATLVGLGEVKSVAFSPDGKLVAAGMCRAPAIDVPVRIWSVPDGKLVRDIRQRGAFGAIQVAFSPSGRVIASANGDGRIQLWSAVDGRHLRELGEDSCVAFSADGAMIAMAGRRVGVTVWSGQGALLHELRDVQALFRDIAFSPTGSVLAATRSQWDSPVCVLWSSTSSPGMLLRMVKDLGGRFLVFSPDGKQLAVSSHAEVRFWNVDSLIRGEWTEGSPLLAERVSVLAWSPSDDLLAYVGAQDQFIHVVKAPRSVDRPDALDTRH